MKLVELLAIPVGFALVRSITKSIDKEPKAKVTPILPKDKGFTLGPAAASMDIAPLIPKGAFKITPTQLAAFVPQTPEQQAFTRERILAPSGTPEQAKMLIESGAIKQGKIKKFGTGVDFADLLARQTPRK